MADTTLKTVFPYNHSIAIVSPCNGATIAQYAKIIKADEGLNSAIATITTKNRVGMDGAIYCGSKPQYKTIIFTIDVSDDRITFEDFYSFFNKDNLYKIILDDKYYINGAISRIYYPYFNNIDGVAEITMECDACYWETDISITLGPYTMNYTNNEAITIGGSALSAFYGQEFEPDITVKIESMNEKSLKGFWFIKTNTNDKDLKIDFTSSWMETSGGYVVCSPCTSNIIQFISVRKVNMTADYLPDKEMKLVWGHTYLFSLRQSANNDDTSTTIQIKGKGRYYN